MFKSSSMFLQVMQLTSQGSIEFHSVCVLILVCCVYHIIFTHSFLGCLYWLWNMLFVSCFMEQGGADVSRILCFNFFLMHIQMGCMVIALFLLCRRNVLVFSTMTIMIDTLRLQCRRSHIFHSLYSSLLSLLLLTIVIPTSVMGSTIGYSFAKWW